ncbi:YcjX family protein [Afifella sp. IM 167]|uniref:YcjX family protein n=1 Tax=Afifella sp. IM 167 TaxID=2033586 RepID=UPI001CD02777|nr:YcjX family protein [Afifella sp. IM 167]MBZ8134726.1 amino acid regulated cytosolic protein [Afifella sp. IM 167]
MASIISLADEARIAFDNILEGVLGNSSTLRLGVTGLSRAGKTVFITALVHNLIHGGRLPLFDAHASGRLAGARLQPQPDDAVPRFDYEAHVKNLVDKRVWPRSTRRISELRVTLEYESASGWKRTFGPGRLDLDIVDYPGEWLLDLALLGKSYAEWSAEAVAMSREPHRMGLAAEWHAALARVDPGAEEDETTARELAAAFTAYLRAARADEHALSMLPPGRFLMPGDLEGSPALTFSPLDLEPGAEPEPGSLAAMMARRYESYRTHVVKPFFREHFARLDRQIVLVDMLAALNAGPAALRDLEQALADVLACFRPGRSNWLTSILQRRIDKILFAATKADHVHRSDHDNLAALLARLTDKAAKRASFAGAEVRVMPLAAVRATREVTVTRDGRSLPAIAGVPLEGEKVAGEVYDGASEIALFPGDLPADPESIFEPPLFAGRMAGAAEEVATQESLALRYLRFRPPKIERTETGIKLSLPHIRLDQALEFLVGDRLQ